jgi:hypothetical protein
MKPKMPVETAEIPAGSPADPPPKAGAKTRLLTLDGLDRRTAAYAATRKLIDDIEQDLGGRVELSTSERQLIQHAAVLGALLTDTEGRWIEGEVIDPTTYCAAINAQRRLFETLGLKRKMKTVPSLQEYLQSKEARG